VSLSVLAANAGKQTQQSATTDSARVETNLLKTIVFITVDAVLPGQGGKPNKVIHVRGTGFLVSVPDSRLPSGRSFEYLVTNRHVAEAIEQDDKGNCTPLQVRQTYVTLNLKQAVNGNRADKVPIQPRWYFSEDQSVDLAVSPVGIGDKYDQRVIALDQFLTTEILDQKQVVSGDKVLTGGFYADYAGLHEIQPILREGILAMFPDGPMTTTMCKSGRIYLADIHVIPGNSGSPIFVIPGLGLGATTVAIGGVPSTFGLLGVVSGYMQEDQNSALRATTLTGPVYANSGISTVVPAQQLLELLKSSPLQQIRDDSIRRQSTP
jgi:hypothetical protein